MKLLLRIQRWLFPPTFSRQRLADRLPVLEAEIESFRMKAGADADKKPWLKSVDKLLTNLRTALDQFETQKGWKIYKAISRTLLYGLAEQPGKPHIARARAIFQEAKGKMELDSWRQKAILGLIGKADDATPVEWSFNEDSSVEDIIKANEILDEHQDNFYDKLLTLNGQIRTLSWAAVWAIAFFIFFSPNIGDFPRHTDIPDVVRNQMLEVLREARGGTQTEDNFGNDQFGTGNPETATEEEEIGNETEEDSIENTLPDSSLKTESGPTTGAPSETGKNTASGLIGLKPLKEGEPPNTSTPVKPTEPHSQISGNERSRLLAMLVILMGLIGAVVSGFLRIIQANGTDGTTPIQLFGATILFARLVLATVAALAVYIFLGTGILVLFSPTVSFELLLAFCFAAGFSEKLVQKGVETLTKEEMYKGQKT
jgi:hypothetical protein